jgi:ATP-binding cassette, subfamily B, bacterial
MQELLSGPTRGTTAADSQVDLPSSYESSLSKIVLRQRTDISLDGQPQTQWLIATSSQLMVALERHNAEASLNAAETLEEVEPYVAVLRRIELADVESLRTTAGTGSGLLQARIDNNWVNVVRFSNSLADTFHHTGRGLEALKNGTATPESLHVETVKRCDKCQLRLGTSIESCPRCLHRSKIASRVWELLKPQINGTILLCVLTVIGVALELVPPKLQQIMVDQILSGPSGTIDKSPFFTALLIVVLSLAASRIMLSFVGWIKGRLATRIGSSLTYNLRAQMVRRLQQLAISYYDRHQAGSLMSRVAYDSEACKVCSIN